MNQYFRELGVGVWHKFMWKRCVILDHKKQIQAGSEPHMGWFDRLHRKYYRPGGINWKKILHWKIIVSFTGIRSMWMKIGVYLKTSIQRYKYICILINLIPNSFIEKDKLHRIVQNRRTYDMPQTGRIFITRWTITLKI